MKRLGESSLSGAGSAGRNSTAARQQGRRPSTPFRVVDRTFDVLALALDYARERSRKGYVEAWVEANGTRIDIDTITGIALGEYRYWYALGVLPDPWTLTQRHYAEAVIAARMLYGRADRNS